MRTDNFIFFLLVSIIAHAVLLIAIVLSKSISFLRVPPQENVIFMHVMPLGNINNVKTRSQNQSEIPDKEEAKKVDSSEEAKPQEKPETNKPQEEKLQTEKPSQPSEPDKKLEVKPEIKPEQKEVKPAAVKKTIPKSEDLDLSSLEKSLKKASEDKNKEKPSEGSKNKSNKKSGGQNKDDQTSSSDNYNENSPESVTAKLLLQKRIESNWGRPPSMRDYENVKIRVRLKLDMNQSVKEITGFEFLNENVPQNVKIAIVESIIRAIKLSEPFDMLSLEYYDHWHDNWLIFSYK